MYALYQTYSPNCSGVVVYWAVEVARSTFAFVGPPKGLSFDPEICIQTLLSGFPLILEIMEFDGQIMEIMEFKEFPGGGRPSLLGQ